MNKKNPTTSDLLNKYLEENSEFKNGVLEESKKHRYNSIYEIPDDLFDPDNCNSELEVELSDEDYQRLVELAGSEDPVQISLVVNKILYFYLQDEEEFCKVLSRKDKGL